MCDCDDCIPESQVNTALYLLEHFHSDSLEWERPQEAKAYYHAIETLEDAKADKLKDNYESPHGDVERSREAREEGYAAATLLGHNHRDWSDEPTTVLEKLRALFS